MEAEERLVTRIGKLADENDDENPVVQDLREILFQYDVDRSIEKAAAARIFRLREVSDGLC